MLYNVVVRQRTNTNDNIKTKKRTGIKMNRNERERHEQRKWDAEKIARRLFGVWDWNGMLTNGVYGESGLTRLANNYLRKHYAYTNWRVGETKFGDGTSKYWIKSL